MEAVAVKKAPKTNSHSSQKKNAGTSAFFPAQNKKSESSRNASLFADSDVFFSPAVGHSKAKNLDQNKNTESVDQAENFRGNPELNPAYLQVVESINSKAEAQKEHEEADKESQAAQSAAPFDQQEKESIAQTSHMESMDEQEVQEFDVERFKSRLRERINQLQLPDNLEEADEFDKNNNIDEVSSDIAQDAGQEQEIAGSAIEAASSSNPDVDAVSPRLTSELPDKAPVGEKPLPVAVAGAVPHAHSEIVLSEPLEQNMGEIHKLTDENNISDEQLAKSNESHFVVALSSKEKAQKHTDESVGNFKIHEESVLSDTEQRNQTESQTFLSSIHGERTNQLADVLSGQQSTKDESSEKRAEIAARIHSIFEETRARVQKHLDNLDQEVSKRFGKITQNAKENFEVYIERRMKAYKDERYSGAEGKLLWVKDKLLGLPEEVNVYFIQGRERFIKELDNSLTGIANYVGQQLTEAKRIIADGKQEISDYVQSLPESLKEIGAEAAQGIQAKFDQLEQNVDNKQEGLIDSLAREYVQVVEEIDESIEEMQAANRGLVDAALDSLNSVIIFIVEIKATLSELLSSAIAVIGAIIEDPIQFLLNLFSGIIQGLESFLSNIAQHLKAGLIGWLIGALGPMGITLPENLFSLKGVFSLVAQILGITWDYIRQKAVRALGEKVVSAMESGFEIFMVIKTEGIAGLWRYIQEKFNDLKTLVIDAIQDLLITKVIMAGVKWIMSLLSPASAFVKAVLMIVDIIKFFVQKAAQVFELVKAFIESVKAIASGSVEFVARAIENALSRALPVLIGFLASLLGITGLTQKVQAIVFKIRARLDEAIDRIIDKAKAWFKKIGGKIKAGAVAIKDKILEWWKIKVPFINRKGEKHSLGFADKENSELTVFSTPTPLQFIIDDLKNRNKDNPDAMLIITQIQAEIQSVNALKKQIVKNKENEEEEMKDVQMTVKVGKEIEKRLEKISEYLVQIPGEDKMELPPSLIDYRTKKIRTQDGESVVGEKMIAEPLSMNPGKHSGSIPTQTTPLWNRVNQRTYTYVRGHLLNHHLHGRGMNENMVPITRSLNTEMESKVESKLKDEVLGSGKVVSFVVTAEFPERPKKRKIIPEEGYLLEKLTFEAKYLELKPEKDGKDPGNWSKGKSLPIVSNLNENLPKDTEVESRISKISLNQITLGDLKKKKYLEGGFAEKIIEYRESLPNKKINTFQHIANRINGIGEERISNLKNDFLLN